MNSDGSKLLEMLSNARIRSASMRGRTVSITFGTNDFRDLSDGQFPAEVWRCETWKDGSTKEHHKATVTKKDRLPAACRKAGSGSCAGATAEWVEIRTPAARRDSGAV